MEDPLQVMDGNNTELQQDGLRVFFRLAPAPAPPASTRVCHEPASAEDTSCLPYATTDENGQVRVLLQIGHNEGNLEVIAQTSGGQPVSHAVTVLDASLEVGGNTDTGPAVQDSALPLSLKAELKDKEGADIAGRCVTAEVTQGGGTLLGSDDAACPMTSPEKRTALTDDEGKVEFTVQRAGSGDEDIVVQVSALGLTVPFLDIVGSLDTPDVPQDIDVFGDVIYIADRTGLQVIDIKKPTSPKPIQSIDLEGTVSRLALDGDRLYVPTSNLMRLYVLDITEPSSPNRRGVVDLVGDVESHGIKGVVAENGHAFIVTDARTNASGTLQVVDVQDGDNPKVVGTALLRFRPRGIAVLGNRVYVTSGDGLFIFNISDPTQPIEERGPMGNFSDITLNGNVAYVVEVRANQYYFTVLDLSVPSTPQLRGALQVQRVRAIDTNFPIAVRGRFACLVEFAFGLLAIDVNDPKTPRWMARIDTPSEVLSVAIAGAGGFIYATDLIFGLQVIRGPLFDRDRNMDGIPDDFLDLDEDGIIDFFDVFPDDPTENRDTNRDGIGDEADEDDDSDGFTDTDEEEASPPTDPKDPRIFPLTLPPSGTTTIVVDADVGAATHPAERNGTPATPYLSITEGLRVIKAWRRQGIDSPLTLEVRAGTYSPTRTQEIFPLEFAGTGPLTLRGAGQEATVIDAAFTAPCYVFPTQLGW